MAAGIYGTKTLNDNWAEDRLQPSGSLTVTSGLHKRRARAPETDMAYIGERYDVLGRISRIPQRPTYAMPNDGFRETLSTNRNDLREPKSHPSFARRQFSAPALVNTVNAPVCPPEKREMDGPLTGFGAPMQRHQSDFERRSWSTTHGDNFGEGSRKKLVKICPASKQPSGVASEAEENRATGMQCGKLCGEYFSEASDPGRDTRTQRAWIPGSDAALRNVHMGGRKPQAPRFDNELSLPMGDGAMAKVRQDLRDRQGRLSRVATHITKGAHMKAGMSLFQDD